MVKSRMTDAGIPEIPIHQLVFSMIGMYEDKTCCVSIVYEYGIMSIKYGIMCIEYGITNMPFLVRSFNTLVAAFIL